jgi:hypothetical protein
MSLARTNATLVAAMMAGLGVASAEPAADAGTPLSDLERHVAGTSPRFDSDMSHDRVPRLLIFTGYDGWGGGGFAHGGLVWSPDGLDKDGFVLKSIGGAGTYRYKSGGTDVVGTQYLGSVLPGWRLKADRFEIAGYAGLDVQHHSFDPDDTRNPLRGTHVGLRVATDVWWEPIRDAMATASASFSTVGTSYWTRAALGWRVFDAFYVGPEAHAMGDDVYRQWRVGAHLTALRTGQWEWSAGVGHVEDSSDRAGFYGRVGLLTRR